MITCDRCGKVGKSSRHFILYKSQFLCWNCISKISGKQFKGCPTIPHPRMSLKEALDRTYFIPRYISKEGYVSGMKSFPAVLTGKTVKLTLVKNKARKRIKKK